MSYHVQALILMTKDINLKSLEAFQAIINTGSATAAAHELGITQSGVSRLLASLEEHVGYQLFYREKGRLVPSEEALALTKEIELALTSVERVSLLAKNIFDNDLGTLKIVAPNSFIAGPLADVVASFLVKHPNVTIDLKTNSPATAREMVAHRSVDCGFIQFPESHPGLLCQSLISGDTVCAVPTTHPLSQKKQLKVKDLKGERLILLGKGRQSRATIEEVFRQARIPMKVKIETQTVAIACSFVKRNLGIALVNGLLAEQYCDDDMVLLPFSPALNHQYGFISSAHAPMSRLAQAFYQHCIAYFESKTP